MTEKSKILIVDDDSMVLESLYELFIDDYDVVTASSGAEAIEVLRNSGDIETIVLDIKMAEMDGLETAARIQKINPKVPIIFCTGYPGDYSETQIENELEPYDYVIKNERPARLERAVKNAVEHYRITTKKTNLAEHARAHYGMVGRSKQMRNVYEIIEKIASTDNKVMILGQTGSGKELVARAIHKLSSRSDKHLAILNCNHKSPDLIESELFGHVRGAYTGAVADRVGVFEYAHRGTLFLDEIGDLDITTQAKLLRALETGEIQKIGSPETSEVDVRLLCATNCDLKKLIDDGKFREDLYYRLKGVVICLPTLAERRSDIPELVDFFVETYCNQNGRGIKLIESSAMDLLCTHDWPGNVRELKHTIKALLKLRDRKFHRRDESSGADKRIQKSCYLPVLE